MSTARTVRGDFTPAAVPIWREVLFGIDWVALHASPVYYGIGVPRGDGAPVIVIPGFLGSDDYLREMYYWLRRIGYTPYYSRIGRNAECPDVLTNRLLTTMDRAYSETGQPLNLIGHSLGGRDRTTVLYGIKRITNRIADDTAFAKALSPLRATLSPALPPLSA